MNALLLVTIFFADTVVYPMQPEKIDPSTVAVTNEHPCGWWPYPYHERYEKFRVRQELEYKSDFDLQLDKIEEQAKKARDGKPED